MISLAPTLGQTTGNGSGTVSLLIWAGILVGIVMLLSGAVMVLRRKMLSGTEEASVGRAGLLDQLRAMHEQGKLTDEEYAAAKRRLVGLSRGGDTPANMPRTRRSG